MSLLSSGQLLLPRRKAKEGIDRLPGRRAGRIKDLTAAQRHNQLPKVIAGVRFNDGIEVIQVSENYAA